jgi:hypothetical protein
LRKLVRLGMVFLCSRSGFQMDTKVKSIVLTKAYRFLPPSTWPDVPNRFRRNCEMYIVICAGIPYIQSRKSRWMTRRTVAEGRLGVIAVCACIYVSISMRTMYIRAVLLKHFSPYMYTHTFPAFIPRSWRDHSLPTKRREIHT